MKQDNRERTAQEKAELEDLTKNKAPSRQKAKAEKDKTEDQDEILGKAYDGRLVRRFMVYLRPYKGRIFLALLLVLGTSVTDLAGPFLTKLAIDNYIAPGRAGDLWQILLLFVGALVAGFILRYWQTYLMQSVGQRVMYDLRVALFSHLQRLSLAFFDRNPVGARLMSRLTSDVDALNEFLSNGLVAMIGDLVTLFAVSIIMLVLDWRLALIMFAVLPFVVLFSRLFQRYMRDSFRQVRTRLAKINGFLQENVSGMLVVQLFNRESRAFNQFQGLNQSYFDATVPSGTPILLSCFTKARSSNLALMRNYYPGAVFTTASTNYNTRTRKSPLKFLPVIFT